jgi:multidrug efflux pump subunit AcrB
LLLGQGRQFLAQALQGPLLLLQGLVFWRVGLYRGLWRFASVSDLLNIFKASFIGLGVGLAMAIVLVYLLIVVNFQSWADPFVIIFAVPGALAGVVLMLLCTGTTFSVPSLMGAIMCVGVSTANSILVVTFANDRREEGDGARAAAFAAGTVRLRPVLMTASAMIIGMVPMSLGLGEGGEQNAPLGRAVIGGLLVATVVTLVVVPAIYCLVRRRGPRPANPDDAILHEGATT